MNELRQRMSPLRDEKYRRYLAEQPCRRCGRTGCQAAHAGHSDWSMKGGDDECVSLCPPCHLEFDGAMKGKGEWWLSQIVLPEEREKYQEWKR